MNYQERGSVRGDFAFVSCHSSGLLRSVSFGNRDPRRRFMRCISVCRPTFRDSIYARFPQCSVRPPRPGEQLFRVGIFTEVCLIATAVTLSVSLRGVLPLGPGFFKSQLGQVRSGLLFSIPFTALFGALSLWVDDGPVETFRAIFHKRPAWQIVLFCVNVAVAEELLFRGFLQATAAAVLHSASSALVLASILFGAVHAYSRLYAIVATAAGIIFGALYLLGGESVLVPVTVHCVYDIVAVSAMTVQWTQADIREASSYLLGKVLECLPNSDA